MPNARAHANLYDKLLELKGEEFGGAAKMLTSFIQQSSEGDSSLEFTEDSLHTITAILDGLDVFPAVPIAMTPTHNDASLTACQSSRMVLGIDTSRSDVSHAQWLARHECNPITITLFDSAGEPLHGVAPEDVIVTVDSAVVGYSVWVAPVEGNTVTLEVEVAAADVECSDNAVLSVHILSGSVLRVPVQVSGYLCLFVCPSRSLYYLSVRVSLRFVTLRLSVCLRVSLFLCLSVSFSFCLPPSLP